MKCFFRVFIKVLVLTFLITNIAQADRLALPAVTDMTAPVVVQSNYATNIDAGEDHQILVTVTDNIAIKSVILFHRDMGSNEYQTKTMRNIVGTDDYATTISADQLNIDGIEYYIQATDSSDNTLLHGYAFSPIIIPINHQVVDTQSAVSTEPKLTLKKEKSYKWLWIGLGALAVGAIAAGGGGGGGGDDSGGNKEPSIVINAPVP